MCQTMSDMSKMLTGVKKCQKLSKKCLLMSDMSTC